VIVVVVVAMRAAARKSNDFNFKAAGRKTEDAFKEVGDSVKEVFRGMEESMSINLKFRPSWWGGGGGGGSPSREPAPAPAEPPAVSIFQALAGADPGPAASAPQSKSQSQSQNAGEDDVAMRRHCAALERLVEIGLSPQAARVSLRHLDSWLVCEAGAAEMAAAEAAAFSAGEPILHVGDSVRLEGLVKNRTTNGRQGMLEAYGADSHRWKVRLNDGQVFWIKPKLLRPLEIKRLPLPPPESPEQTGDEQAVQSKNLAVGWARLEARQMAWKEEQEAREITLLEREEALRKLQEALEDEQDVLVEQRRSLAGEQARLGRERVETVSHSVPSQMTFDMADDSPADSPAPLDSNFMRPSALTERIEDDRSCRPVRADEVESEGEPDEMWDMDWSALAGGGAKAGASPGRGQKCHDLGARNWRSRIGPGSWCAAAARGETETAGDG